MTEQPANRKRVRSRVDAFSASSVARLDARTKEGRLARAVRDELVEHVGGEPSTTQKLLIEHAALLIVHLAVMDRKFSETGDLCAFDSRRYLSWSRALAFALSKLGTEGAKKKAPDLATYLQQKSAAGGAA